jgi:hypothetical protein
MASTELGKHILAGGFIPIRIFTWSVGIILPTVVGGNTYETHNHH